jgi:hypothetical protein
MPAILSGSPAGRKGNHSLPKYGVCGKDTQQAGRLAMFPPAQPQQAGVGQTRSPYLCPVLEALDVDVGIDLAYRH